ncbi:mandelate racemase/muconate lactonizing enzyme family protein [Conexibacter sp. CPCC 206217]|uniref:mandelate racemase/muconate lactonizing enzyme family protein n=1 Tax=Conexibacter sp. CPCC 206217 TaxID=3064574 RepID=UPI00271B6C41|nr:mandelate racemase/muconate lactonizing enzyme family protein [Conexibacter sp. CPCC 206217]MDO8208923.1 mandelate racemase/muconate lactonizing enzyme family protein [Conexibacter sp. CPCC 206217]
MTKIDALEARTVAVPLPAPTSFARRTVTHRHYTLVRAHGGGHEGIGFCYAGSSGGPIVTESVRQLVAPAVVGEDSHRAKGIWEELYQELILHSRAGSVMRAVSAVDVALWDLNARIAGLPLWQYLGAVATDSVPAYASGGYYLDGKRPEDLADEMRSYVALGFRAVKMKIGRLSPAGDAERLAAVRAAVGPDVLVMCDANNAWRDLPTALAAVRALEPYDPYWIEEPFGPDDVANHARLARATPVTVATGEIEVGKWQHLRLLQEGAAQILQTDAAVCGGISEYQRIAATADSFGVTMAPHWFHDLHVHLVASTPNARFVEFFADDRVFNFRELIDTQLEIGEGGTLRLPRGPGLGFEFDADAVERRAVDAWR